ncbi:hypothetical protein [Paenibacillus sacheonensis]|uniref:YgiT-type zinc finger protein n=1 Tax=Paenibacillus sacheonensis TaxID=742054 RepID=A0A7X5C4A5_9BACL|nr:hypothetical protein [Paenibacillus sacheonensis]MBM7565759.1 ribosomal protein S27E [Paenibacillus sacheonensis]NBC72184.1 hypothetical protein [Paenibacillus sacheonensis]
MSEFDDEDKKRIISDFESILPKLWERARSEAKMDTESEFLSESLEGKSIEELWEMAYGIESLEEQKLKREARKLKADYGEAELNILVCPLCNHDQVINSDVDWEITSGNKKIKSIKVRGAVCLNCSETFVASDGVKAVLKAIQESKRIKE